MRHKAVISIVVACAASFVGHAAWACPTGPDARGEAALGAAAQAQRVVLEQLGHVVDDRGARDFYADVSERWADADLHAQGSLLFESASVSGFSVCDATALQDARLLRERLGFGVGLGYRDTVRVEARLFGVSASVVQDDVAAYRPPRGEGGWASVPGAGGLGQGMWALRLELFDRVAGTVGRVSDQTITHRVGWEEEFDDEGNSQGLQASETTHWSRAAGGATHWFAAVGLPRRAMSDIVFSPDALESVGVRSGWFEPHRGWPSLRGAARWDGVARQPVAELAAGLSPVTAIPDLRLELLGSGEFAQPRLRELSGRARWTLPLTRLTDEFSADLDLVTISARTGLYGGARLGSQTGGRVVPGVEASTSIAIPIFALVRLGGFLGLNRPDTLAVVPHAVGRPEWGVNLYTTYAF